MSEQSATRILSLHICLLLSMFSAILLLATPARGADNAIITENQKTGTTSWQIGLPPYKVSNDTDLWIRGYASATSINRGEAITFNVTVNPYNWKSGPVQYMIDIYRIGWYGGLGGRLMKHAGPFTGVQQPGGTSVGGVTSPGCPYDPATGMIACQWTGDGLGHGSYILDTSLPTLSGVADWTSGIYLAVLTTAQMQYNTVDDPDHQTYIVFAIRDDARKSDILFQQAVLTYQAYNNYPDDGKTGKSLYDSGSYGSRTTLGTLRAVKVSFDRPYTYSDHTGAGEFLKWELYFVRCLERNGYDVSYATDIDVHANGAQLLNHKVSLAVGHSEYWSKEMRTAVETARDQGTSIGFFGANTMYSQVRLEPSPTSGVANRVLVGYKDATLDPVNNPGSPNYNPPLTTVPWRNSPVNRPEQETIGIMYLDYFDETLPAYSFVVQNSANWLYTGTGLVDGAKVPGIVGYELDARLDPYPLPSAVTGTYVLLSDSPFTGANSRGVANSSIYQAAKGPGAWVFGSGTIEWSWGLDSYIPPQGMNTGSVPAPSQGIQQLTANFLNAATGSTPPPPAPTGLVATAASGTSINLTWTDNPPAGTAVLVERSTDNITFAQIASLAGTATAYTDTGLTTGTTYYYRVRTQNSAGTSVYSNTASATTTTSVPGAPSALTAAVASDTSINLTWTNNPPAGTALLVERSTDNIAFTQISSLAGTATAYADTGLTSGTTYYYRLRAQNSAGTSAYSNTASATTTTSAPGAPSALTAVVASGTSVNLTWTNNPPAGTAVLVERSTDNIAFAQIASLAGTATTYADTGLTSGTTYYYRVRAQNSIGTSAYSNTASATTTTGVPGAPSALTAVVASGTSVNLTWTNNPPAGTAVLVERSTDNIAFAQIASLAGTAIAYADAGLTSGTTYYYRVRAQNSTGTSAYSNTASATTTATVPGAPSALTAAAASSTSINLTWTNNPPAGTAVLVERSTDNIAFAQIASLAGTAIAYADAGLTSGTTYYYRVRAQNSAGTSAYSNTASAITAATVPGAPSALTAAAASGTSINLTWTNNPPAGTALLVERSTDNIAFAQIASLAGTAIAYADAGLTSGTTYYYRVRTQNSAGTSAYSNTASTTTTIVPGTPSGLTAAAASSTSISLAWTTNPPAGTALLVERSTNNSTFTQIASLAGTATAYTNAGLSRNTTYYYRVRAQNSAGTSAYSNTASASTNTPAAPSGLSAVAASDTSINLTWINNVPTGTAVLIERSLGSNKTFAQIASVAGTATAYTDTGLAAGTQYYYRVRAHNAAGSSPYSNTANASTTGSLPAAPSNVAAGQDSASPRTQIDVYWTDNSNNETAFLIFRSLDNVTFTQLASVGANITVYRDAGLTPATRYYYYVKASNASGTSAASNTDWTITQP